MPRMIDLIRQSKVPSNQMQWAARGALAVPADENIEILVHLALHNRLFAEQARMTLAGWDEKASIAAAANPETSAEVLGYLIAPGNLRPVLLPALVENTSVSEEALDVLAVTGSREVVEILLRSPRVARSERLVQALISNPRIRSNEAMELQGKAIGEPPPAAIEEPPPPAPEAPAAAGESGDHEVETAVAKYLHENATEIAAEQEKPFEAIGPEADEGEEHTGAAPETAPAAVPAAAAAAQPAALNPAQKPGQPKKHPAHIQEKSRDSTLQKIAKLNIQGRISLAMRGTKEERAILIRDATKLVCLAVLDSPKVSDAEVEKFATQKNVLEAVLRAIPMKRRYAKNYAIMRNLVFNPRTPLDLSLGLMKNLLVHDLKNLSGNKEVSDTIRKLALRMFKQRIEKKG